MKHRFTIVTESLYGSGDAAFARAMTEFGRKMEMRLADLKPEDELIDVKVTQRGKSPMYITGYIRWIEHDA